MGIRIDALDAAASAQADHELPAMRDGATVKLTAQQLATFIIALVTDSAPTTLDTLNELAAALGDDPNFATTVTNALAGKADKASNLSDLASLPTARTNLMGVSTTTDNTVVRFDGTTGAIQNSGVTIDDNNDFSGARDISPARGVKFAATQNPSADPNTLDDYEEGATTPTVTPDTGTITTSSCTLNYTKIGRLVTFSAVITITTAGTGAGAITMPLPFTASAAASAAVREVGATGVAGAASIASGAASCRVARYDNATLIVSGYSIYVSGSYIA